jgi:hypothetical protein
MIASEIEELAVPHNLIVDRYNKIELKRTSSRDKMKNDIPHTYIGHTNHNDDASEPSSMPKICICISQGSLVPYLGSHPKLRNFSCDTFLSSASYNQS